MSVVAAKGTDRDLVAALEGMDGAGYGAYKRLVGSYSFGGLMTLHIDRVQSDPFAAPSQMRVTVPGATAGFPAGLLSSRVRRGALCDFLARRFYGLCQARRYDMKEKSGG